MSTTPENSGDDGGLNLLLPQGTFEEPLWKSLFRNLDEFFFPKKLPPLVLESKPVPVKDIWGFYNYKKNGALYSSAVHVVILAVIIGGTLLARRVVQHITHASNVTLLVLPEISRRFRLPRRKWVVAVVVVTATNCKPARASCPRPRWNSSLRPWWW